MRAEIMNMDVLDGLARLADSTVQCVVTSPPYWDLRNYGIEGQIGLEESPDAYVERLVGVFREVRRVLRADGTVWLNLGDTYSGARAGSQGESGQMADRSVASARCRVRDASRVEVGLPPKNLVGIPWRVAFALQADGWFLRSEIIWAKPNPMPESVRDRPTKAHEQVFLLTKSARYYYDADAVAERVSDTSLARWSQSGIDAQNGSDRVPGKTNGPMKAVGGPRRPQAQKAVELARAAGLTDAHISALRAVGITDTGKARITQSGTGKNDPEVQRLADEAKAVLGGYYREFLIAEKRNLRTVWDIPTVPYKGAHFATFPPALVIPCIKAGSREGDLVLDPFCGAGTTGVVARKLARRFVGIELNPEYVELADRRIRRECPPNLFDEEESTAYPSRTHTAYEGGDSA